MFFITYLQNACQFVKKTLKRGIIVICLTNIQKKQLISKFTYKIFNQ